jgi:hypothetical protein
MVLASASEGEQIRVCDKRPRDRDGVARPVGKRLRTTEAVWKPPVQRTGIETARFTARDSGRFIPSTRSDGRAQRCRISKLTSGTR